MITRLYDSARLLKCAPIMYLFLLMCSHFVSMIAVPLYRMHLTVHDAARQEVVSLRHGPRNHPISPNSYSHFVRLGLLDSESHSHCNENRFSFFFKWDYCAEQVSVKRTTWLTTGGLVALGQVAVVVVLFVHDRHTCMYIYIYIYHIFDPGIPGEKTTKNRLRAGFGGCECPCWTPTTHRAGHLADLHWTRCFH